jgi:prepilin-type N-terminal cleavage/methylation domain-containing protein
MKIRKIVKSGFTLIEIMIVVSLIGLLASIAIPTWVNARAEAQEKTCINTLRQIDGAAETWTLENRRSSTSTYTLADVKPYIRLDAQGNIPPCPANGTYSPGRTVSDSPTCSVPGHVLP